jgi:hypothetical protein
MPGLRKDDSKNQTAWANISAKERFDASQELQNRLASTNSAYQRWKASFAQHLRPGPFRKGDQRFPKMIVRRYQHPTMRLTKRL